MENPFDGFDENTEIKHVVASDLMSDVLVIDDEDFLLVTSLNSDQVVRTADIVGASGIILVNGKKPFSGLVKLADEHELPILSTELSCFETCVALGKLL